MKRKLLSYASILFLILSCVDEALSQGTWSVDSTSGFQANAYNTSCVVDGKIYVMPGIYDDALQAFDPATHKWSTPTTTGVLITDQLYLSASVILNGKIYVIGGSNSLFGSKSVTNHIYDPTTHIWSVLEATGTFTPRDGLTASAVGGKIYVFGGDTSFTTPINTVEVFDPSTNSWSTPVTTGTFTPRSDLTSCVVNGKIYVMGGWDHNAAVLNTLEVFDPLTNTWSTPITTGTFTARHLMTSDVVNGKIYVLGGSTGDHIDACNIVEVFDPVTNKWSTPIITGTFSPRFALSSGVVNGNIYVLGGYLPHAELNTNEVFTPGTSSVKIENTFSEIMLSPNPTTGIITVHNAPANMLHVTITNVLGETVSEAASSGGSDFTFDHSKLPLGTYFVRFSGEGEVVTRKIIKE